MKKAIIILAGFFLLVTSCEQERENQPPVISSITSSINTAEVNQACNLNVSASDPDGDPLTYKWGSSGGTFPNGITSSNIVWQAPYEPGNYKIWVTVDDGHNHAVNGDMDIQVVRSQGTLVVNSTPTGAIIYISNRDTGKLTNASFQLDPGMYQVVLVKTDYQTWIGDAQVYANQITTLNVSLIPIIQTGTLVVNSTPSEADIFLNGNSTGKQTNASFTLNPGNYSILLRKTGYQDWTGNAGVNANQTTTINATLPQIPSQPNKGTLEINSTPDGADININDTYTGRQTNYTFSLDPGVYSFSLNKPGYNSYRKTGVQVYANQKTIENVILTPEIIQKIIYANNDATVMSDSPNENTGRTTTMTALLSGSQVWFSLVRFDMSSIPSNAVINRAILKLYCYDVFGNNANVEVYRILRYWSETTITWNLMSTGFFDTGRITAEVIEAENIYYNFNIKNLVQSWVDGSYPNHGVLLWTTINNGGVRFLTRESNGNKPSLDIEYK